MPAFADDPPPVSGEARPWAVGVSNDDQKSALALFTEGTQLLKDAYFKRAVALYRQALTRWDHPAIHFNLAKALMNLDEPAEAYAHFESAMKFGGQPLDDDQIQQIVQNKQYLYDNELAELTVSVQETGAIVTLNGTQILVGPGSWTGMAQPGKATLIAAKEGFQTAQVKPDLVVGKKKDVALELVPISDSIQYERPFSNAIPWSVLVGGIVILGGGALANWQASSAYKEYDDGVEACNRESATAINDDTGTPRGEVTGCVPDSSLKDSQDRGKLMETLSLAGYIAGGTLTAAGIVLMVINRERPVQTEGTITPNPVSVIPYLGPDGAGFSATVGF